MNYLNLFLEIFVMGSALLILVMTVISYRLSRSGKLLILGGAFVIFFVRGLLFLLGNFIDPLEGIFSTSYWLAADFLILGLIYLAIIRK